MTNEMVTICGLARIAPDHPQAYDAPFLAERIKRFEDLDYSTAELEAAIRYSRSFRRDDIGSTTITIPWSNG